MLRIAYDPEFYAHPLPEKHRFPMEKYTLLPEQLRYEGTVSGANFFVPEPASEALVQRVHEAEYLEKLKTQQLSRKEERRTGFPLSPRLVERELRILGGTLQNVEFALEYGLSMNIAGGTHHAYAAHGEGFCLLNDMAVAAQWLLDTGKAKQILILDLDVHQGNGTAKIFEKEPRIFTFSMHGEKNYPHLKETSDLDIALPDNAADEQYLALLQSHLSDILENFKPDFVFFQSGVDVLEQDKLGRLGLSIQGCRSRDQFVLSTLYGKALPVAVSMGGGYSPRIADIVEAHANTFRLAQAIYFA